MLLWNGACVVHEEFKGESCAARGPEARVPPESPPGVIEQADYVGSTSGLIAEVRNSPAAVFIVATDKGIFHKMRESAPDKQLIEAPTAGRSATCRSCAACPWMAMNGLRKLHAALVEPAAGHEITVLPTSPHAPVGRSPVCWPSPPAAGNPSTETTTPDTRRRPLHRGA